MSTRRTWPQRIAIGAAIAGSIGSFVAAGALYAGQQVLEDRNLVQLEPSAGFDVTGAPADGDRSDAGSILGAGDALVDTDGDGEADAPVETFPPAEPSAKNYLVTGADNNACIDPDSPYAGAFGDRSDFGERSDTIMVWRVNPAAGQVAVLSFPRDLWVQIAGQSRTSRINAAYQRDNPQRLIDTISLNFGIPIDHYVQVDFCAFKTLVDGAGGVEVPFEYPVTDRKTGLYVPEAGCFNFDGEHALAYVRSRELRQFIDEEWVLDGTSDLGRISRQQDFIRRVVDSLLARGAFSPSVIASLIETSDQYLTYDTGLTPAKILELAGVLRTAQDTLSTYQIEATGRNINGNAVLIPRINGGNMQAVLAVFQGKATLAAAPEQEFTDVTTTTLFAPDTTTPTATTVPDTTIDDTVVDDTAVDDTAVDDGATTTVEAVPFETLPEVVAEENTQGVVPDPEFSCR